ncbi:MAG: hypothetical protein K0B87_02845 [Candidatus Syntrophosphaera sp.]|nr:hypothetical protein [Candidatus Syntrophosphaera sp.]
MIKNLFVSFAVLMAIGLGATPIQWVGTTSTNWHTASNWNPAMVPISAEVIIPGTASHFPQIYQNDASCATLTINSGGSLTIRDSKELDVNGEVSISGLLIMENQTWLDVYGHFQWQAGATADFSGYAQIRCRANMTFAAGSDVQIDDGQILFQHSSQSLHLYNYSPNTQLNHLDSAVTYPSALFYSGSSTHDLDVVTLYVQSWASFVSYYSGNIIVRGHLNSQNATNNGFQLHAGTLVMQGDDKAITLLYPSDHFHNLKINSPGTISLISNINVNGNLTLESGILAAGNKTISLKGNWVNQAGAGAFSASTSRVVFSGDAHQYCNSTNNFHTIEVNKGGGALRVNSSSAVVTCAQYDWTAGAVDVLLGTFTANLLLDNRIAGKWYLNPGGTINLTNSGTSRYVDLVGEIHIYGGEFNVFGGDDNSWWAGLGATHVHMEDGILDFHDTGVLIQNYHAFTHDISGGTIRMKGNFSINRSDFNPTAGTVELAGTGNATVSHAPGSNLYHLTIDKNSANTVTAVSNLDIYGHFELSGGSFLAPDMMRVGRNWYNNVGSNAFVEGIGKVVFFGDSGSYVFANEVFWDLELDKSANNRIMKLQYSYNGIVCHSFDWTCGMLIVSSGASFTAEDLLDPGILGIIEVNGGGTVNLHQDPGQRMDLRGSVAISEGSTLNVYGGSANCSLSYGGDPGTLIMSGGVLDFKDRGIYLPATGDFTANISDGVIRTVGNVILYRDGFNPGGGTIEMYGSGNASLQNTAGSSFFNVLINKTAPSFVTGSGPIVINGSFTVDSGRFNAPAQMSVARHWQNNVGPEGFYEGSGRVVFIGSLNSYVYGETFNVLELNKPGSSIFVPSGYTLNCASYDWSAGTVQVTGGTFNAASLEDNYIAGAWSLGSGTVNLTNSGTGRMVTLGGDISISGGVFNVFGGATSSVWGYPTPASLTMSGGVLDFKDTGIELSPSYAFTGDISGGTIRTVLSFQAQRSDFTPTGGTIELYGDFYAVVSHAAGANLFNLTINKATSGSNVGGNGAISLHGNLDINGGNFLVNQSVSVLNAAPTTINAGTLNLNHNTFSSTGDVNVNGTLIVDYGSTLSLSHGKSLTVNAGGYLEVLGGPTQPATITHNSAGQYYALSIESGGTIAASYAIFEYMNRSGVNIKYGALVHASYSLNHCTFRNGMSTGRLLIINNAQNFNITGASFPTSTGTYNVSKSVDQGSVFFAGWSGAFGGPGNEDDAFNRVFWQGTDVPPIYDLAISHVPSVNQIRLDWTYPLPVTEFKIWRSATPDGTYSLVGGTAFNYWQQEATQPSYFYRVTAVVPDP